MLALFTSLLLLLVVMPALIYLIGYGVKRIYKGEPRLKMRSGEERAKRGGLPPMGKQ